MRSRFTFSLFVVVAVLVSASAFAQETITVRANVVSVVEFNVSVDGTALGSQLFDFGNVDALGINLGNADTVTPDAVLPQAVYVKNNAFLWNIRSAPRGTGEVTSTASKTAGTDIVPDAVGRTSMALNQLRIRWERTSANTSGTVTSAYTALTGGPQTWLTGATVGSGAGALGSQSGDVDLELTVDDLDQVELNEWQIVFTANVT
jgi:hypothetical protein